MPRAKKTAQTNPAQTNPFVAQTAEAARSGLDTLTGQLEKGAAQYQEQVAKAQALTERNADQANDLFKGQIAAFYASQQAYTKGMLDLTMLAFEQVMEAVAEVETAGEKILACKSVEEAAEIQSELVQLECDRAYGNAQRIADVAAHIADDVASPLRDQAMTTLEEVRAQLAA